MGNLFSAVKVSANDFMSVHMRLELLQDSLILRSELCDNILHTLLFFLKMLLSLLRLSLKLLKMTTLAFKLFF